MSTPQQDMLIQQTLVTTVACGDDGLLTLLENNVSLIWCMAGATCTPEIQYLKTQLGLIELAQDYSRNQIDRASVRASNQAEDKFDSSNVRDAESQRTAQATRCAWSHATSFQQFSRQSAEHDRAQSASNALGNGWSFNTGYDRSTQRSNGRADASSTTTSKTDGDGTGFSKFGSVRTSSSSSGTGPMAGAPNVTPGDFTYSLPSIDLSGVVTFTLADGFSFNAPTITPPQFNDEANDDYANPGRSGAPCPTDPDAPCNPLPSYGRGYNIRYSFSVGVPTIGVLRVGWGEGANFRQSMVCTGGNTKLDATSKNHLDYAQTDTGDTSASSTSHDEATNVHNVHRSGASHRESQSRLDASSTGATDAHGESHTGNDRAGYSQGSGEGQGTARSTSHSQGLGRGYADSVNVGESRKWSQIFDSLQDLWKRVFDELTVAEKILTATSGIKIGSICTTAVDVTCNPRANRTLKAMNRPCQPCTPCASQLGTPTWGGGMRVIR